MLKKMRTKTIMIKAINSCIQSIKLGDRLARGHFIFPSDQ
jgi:hypothetical protein